MDLGIMGAGGVGGQGTMLVGGDFVFSVWSHNPTRSRLQQNVYIGEQLENHDSLFAICGVATKESYFKCFCIRVKHSL